VKRFCCDEFGWTCAADSPRLLEHTGAAPPIGAESLGDVIIAPRCDKPGKLTRRGIIDASLLDG
jgi:hypothetical protein